MRKYNIVRSTTVIFGVFFRREKVKFRFVTDLDDFNWVWIETNDIVLFCPCPCATLIGIFTAKQQQRKHTKEGHRLVAT